MQRMKVGYENGITWSDAAGEHAAAARRLLRAFETQVEESIGAAGRLALRAGARGLHALLGSEFGSELEDLAEAVEVEPADLVLGNLAYDLTNAAGCSTFVVDTPSGPLHARNLDWTFPGRVLRKETTVVEVEGAPCGDYSLVTWPGFFGALTAVAPGRFSVTVNYVRHSDHGFGAALKWAMAGYWPVPWAVRIALDQCRNFAEAVKTLETVNLISPVLFTVAGPRKGEGVVIERGPRDFAFREMEEGAVAVTNHYASDAYEDDNGDLSEMDTVERLESVEESIADDCPEDAKQALAVLDQVAAGETQHQVVMRPRDGALWVRVPGERTWGRELRERHDHAP